MTRAPSSARIIEANGHASTRDRSRIVVPSRGFTATGSFSGELAHALVRLAAELERRRERQVGDLVEEPLRLRHGGAMDRGQLLRDQDSLLEKIGVRENPD